MYIGFDINNNNNNNSVSVLTYNIGGNVQSVRRYERNTKSNGTYIMCCRCPLKIS